MKTVAERIYQQRCKYHLSMEQLGALVGVSRATINKWEKAQVESISRPHINKMAEIFHCPPEWLLGYDGANNVTVTYRAPDREEVTLNVDNDYPIIGKTALKARLYQAAANVDPSNIEIAIQLLTDLATPKENSDPK